MTKLTALNICLWILVARILAQTSYSIRSWGVCEFQQKEGITFPVEDAPGDFGLAVINPGGMQWGVMVWDGRTAVGQTDPPKSHLEEHVPWHFLFARSIQVGMDQILHLLARFTPKSSGAVFDPQIP